jgi:hypothetical protein
MTTRRRPDVSQHESSLIKQGVIRKGARRGQIWTTCSHPGCAKGSAGLLVSTDSVPYLARLSADRHLAEHERTDKVTT